MGESCEYPPVTLAGGGGSSLEGTAHLRMPQPTAPGRAGVPEGSFQPRPGTRGADLRCGQRDLAGRLRAGQGSCQACPEARAEVKALGWRLPGTKASPALGFSPTSWLNTDSSGLTFLQCASLHPKPWI